MQQIPVPADSLCRGIIPTTRRFRPSDRSGWAGRLASIARTALRLDCLLVGAALAISPLAHAEIERLVVPAGEGVGFHWWPKLQPLPGWHQDREQSLRYSINGLAPDNVPFETAPVVIYAKAVYKPMARDTGSLAALIEKERKEFVASVPDAVVREVDTLRTADGQELRSFLYFSRDKALWERVSYGEEGDFYLIFTISSGSLAAFNSAAAAYEKVITDYRK